MTRKFKKDFIAGEDKEYSFVFTEHIPAKHPKAEDYIKASVGSFEDEENIRQLFFYPYLKKDAWFMDVGAGFGSYTLPALAFGMNVLAFSPEAEIDAIAQNMALNRFNCELSRIGLYDKVGFFDPTTNTFSETKDNDNMIVVSTYETFKLNSVSDERRYTYVKIDVEGAELPVLKGMEPTIKRDKPYLLVENHLFLRKDNPKFMEEEVISYIDSLGLGYKHETLPYHAISFTLFSP